MKAGDKVRYVVGGKIGWESKPWPERGGLELGKVYEISFVALDDAIVVKNCVYRMHPGHFKLITKEKEEMNREKKLEWIINFMLLKDSLIQEASEGSAESIFRAADVVDITAWSNENINLVYIKLNEEIENASLDTPIKDGSICPWCILVIKTSHIGCYDCSFGSRNGICGESGSLYHRISLRTQGGSLSLVLIKNIDKFKALTVSKPKPKRRFEGAKVGDLVHTEQYGPGKITGIGPGEAYPIEVKFGTRLEYYPLDGKCYKDDFGPTLHKGREPIKEFYTQEFDDGSVLNFKLEESVGRIALRVYDKDCKAVDAGYAFAIETSGRMMFPLGLNSTLNLTKEKRR